MTPEQLKASILQYAIQGKLVEQRAEEGTGEELFQEIERKREVLIKEKIIKKDKRTNSIINFQEVPFDIPENWMWVTLFNYLKGDLFRNEKLKHEQYNAKRIQTTPKHLTLDLFNTGCWRAGTICACPPCLPKKRGRRRQSMAQSVHLDH